MTKVKKKSGEGRYLIVVWSVINGRIAGRLLGRSHFENTFTGALVRPLTALQHVAWQMPMKATCLRNRLEGSSLCEHKTATDWVWTTDQTTHKIVEIVDLTRVPCRGGIVCIQPPTDAAGRFRDEIIEYLRDRIDQLETRLDRL